MLDDRAEYHGYHDYGVISKTGCDEKIREMFEASFPDSLVKTYKDLDYRFFGQRDCACEQWRALGSSSPFYYDEAWEDISVIHSVSAIDHPYTGFGLYRTLTVGKILIHPQTQTIIHRLILGGGDSTDRVSDYRIGFDFFDIDPSDFSYRISTADIT